MSLRLVFLGTPEFAVPALARLVADGHEVAAVYAQPPRRAGRGMDVTASPVARFAAAHNLAVRTPASLAGCEVESFAALGTDAAVVVAYGLILPGPVLQAPRHGCYNIHASLLPRWRGAAPIQRAIMAGDETSGVSIMRITEGLDEGPVCLTEAAPIGPRTTAGALHDALARCGAELVSQALRALEAGSLRCAAQAAEGATYARKIAKSETRIDFTRNAHEVVRHIHGLSPYPGAWLELPAGQQQVRVKVLEAKPTEGSGPPGTVLDDGLAVACGAGAVRLLRLQREGRSAAEAAAFLRGLPVPGGTRLA